MIVKLQLFSIWLPPPSSHVFLAIHYYSCSSLNHCYHHILFCLPIPIRYSLSLSLSICHNIFYQALVDSTSTPDCHVVSPNATNLPYNCQFTVGGATHCPLSLSRCWFTLSSLFACFFFFFFLKYKKKSIYILLFFSFCQFYPSFLDQGKTKTKSFGQSLCANLVVVWFFLLVYQTIKVFFIILSQRLSEWL